jgi:peptidyl-prolyl cis-trans isomerase SurA
VIRTKQGFIILKLLEHKPEGVLSEKEAEEQVQERLYYDKLQPAVREFLTQLREDSYIDIKPGFVDSGASPKQTKPVMTSANTAASEQGDKAKQSSSDKPKKKKKQGNTE